MKKHLIAAAVAGIFAGPVMAQNVTIGGTLDTSYQSTTQAVSRTADSTYNARGVRPSTPTETRTQGQVNNSFWSTSNINFKGTEDLGGGLKAFFHVEGAVLTDVGAGTDLGNRVTQVGVSGAFGTVNLGRGSTFMNDYATSAGHGLGNFANLPFLTPARPNNAINYITPTFNDISARVTVGQGESDTANKSDGNYRAISVQGKVAGLSFAAGQARQDQKRAGSTGRAFFFNAGNAGNDDNLITTITATDGVFTFPLTATTANVLSVTPSVAATDGKLKDTLFALSYDFGVARVLYQNLRSKSSGVVADGNATAELDRKIQAATVIVPFGNTTFFVNYTDLDFSDDKTTTSAGSIVDRANRLTDNKADILSVGVRYSLSKRTAAYFVHRDIDNKGDSSTGSNLGSGVRGKDAKTTAIGLTHTF